MKSTNPFLNNRFVYNIAVDIFNDKSPSQILRPTLKIGYSIFVRFMGNIRNSGFQFLKYFEMDILYLLSNIN